MSETVMPADRLMDVEAVAAYMNMKTSWIYDQWKSQNIPFFRLGGQLRAKRAELDEWLSAHRAA